MKKKINWKDIVGSLILFYGIYKLSLRLSGNLPSEWWEIAGSILIVIFGLSLVFNWDKK